jgi:hypothetical protein
MRVVFIYGGLIQWLSAIAFYDKTFYVNVAANNKRARLFNTHIFKKFYLFHQLFSTYLLITKKIN